MPADLTIQNSSFNALALSSGGLGWRQSAEAVVARASPWRRAFMSWCTRIPVNWDLANCRVSGHLYREHGSAGSVYNARAPASLRPASCVAQ